MRFLGILLATAILFCVSSPAYPRTWHVTVDQTGDVPTIQAAIDNARPGDDVLVAPGTYTWADQGASGTSMLVMKSGVMLHSEAGPEVTVLDAQGQGRVILCEGVDDQAVIEGFSITRGATDGYPGTGGGGICCYDNSSPRIVGNVITCCATGLYYWRAGGGISCAVNSSPEISGNEIISNSACDGGGVYCGSSSNARIIDNVISDHCLFPAIEFWDTYGGGILSENSSPLIDGNVITENSAHYGGGICCRGSDADIHENLIADNSACNGGGIMCSGGTCYIWRNTIVGNGSPCSMPYHGTVACDYGDAYIWCNIIAETPYCMAISCEWNDNTDVQRNDLWNNAEGDSDCDIAPNNIHEDPLFCDAEAGDFMLREDSPCLSGVDGFPCMGRIGAHGVGCGSTTVQHASWGRVKALYRK